MITLTLHKNKNMILQLNPPLPIKTPKGMALAHFITDYGPEIDLMWTAFIDETGECWTFSNREIRAQNNVTMGRKVKDPMEEELKGGVISGWYYDTTPRKGDTGAEVD